MPIFSKYNKKQSNKWLDKVLAFMSYTDSGLNNMSRVLLNAMERISILEDRAGLTAEREAIKVAAEKKAAKATKKAKKDELVAEEVPAKKIKKTIKK